MLIPTIVIGLLVNSARILVCIYLARLLFLQTLKHMRSSSQKVVLHSNTVVLVTKPALYRHL